MNKLEEIARAICVACSDGAPCICIDGRCCKPEALAAMEVMREPSEKMKAVGSEAWHEEKSPDYIYRTMIQAALEE